MKILLAVALFASLYCQTVRASIDLLTYTYEENFDTLTTLGGTNLGVSGIMTMGRIPGVEWNVTRLSGSSNGVLLLGPDNGGTPGGNPYSYGANGSTDRALGSQGSSGTVPAIGVNFVNKTEV